MSLWQKDGIEDRRLPKQQHFQPNPLEDAGYFQVPGAHLYSVLHGVQDPVARVLLVGPFGSERHYSYIPWVRWARFLAARKVECLRYDYRGVGESTGVFEEMSFTHWIEDVDLLAQWLKNKSLNTPLILHGLELGAVLAGKAFESSAGDALLMWAPPAGANQALRLSLQRRISIEQAFKYGAERKPLSSYIEQLENGESLEVDGYRWTTRLWRDSLGVELHPGLLDGSLNSNRPSRTVNLDKNAIPLIKGSSVGYDAVGKDFTALFTDNLEWIINNAGAAWGQI